MRVLLVNKYLYARDGVTTLVAETARLLAERGHQTVAFGQDERGAGAAFDMPRVTVRPVSMDAAGRSPAARVRAFLRILFGAGARSRLAQTLAYHRPDVAHLHNFYHHLGTPIIGTLKRRGVPVVMTLHDYKLMCADYLFLRRGKPCTACLAGGPFEGLRHRCVRGATFPSLVCFLEALFHRRFYRAVDRFIAPSEFMAARAREAHVPAHKIVVIRNPAPAAEGAGRVVPPKEGAQPLILFLGRLYPEKGADVLIRAIRGRTERRSAPPATCLIAGDGPERPRLEALAAGHPVEFAGFVDGAAKADLLARATAVVVPSRWYENAPMAILEAFAAGTPVVASRIGGIPEMVRDGVEGLLVEPGDAGDLARALDRLLGDATLRRRLGRQARETAARAHAPERYVADLERVYRDAGAGER